MSVDSTLRKAAKLAKAGDRPGAAALYRQVLAKFPGNVAARNGLAALGASPAPDGGSANRAADGPHPAPRDLKALETLLQRGDTARAIAEGQRLALMFPASAPLHNLLAIGFSKAGRMEEAARSFRRTTELSPADAGVQLNLANALMPLGRYGEAAEAAGAALALQPSMAPAAALQGVALAQAGRHGEAEAAFRTLIRLAPDRPEGHLGLGNVLAATGRGEAAIEAYEAAGVRAPDDPKVPSNIGATLVGLGRIEDAIATMEPTLSHHPEHLPLRTNLAKALRDAGAVGRALDLIDATFDQGQESGELWALKGACLKELGDEDGTKAALARAVELAPGALELLSLRWLTEPVPLDHPDHARIATLVETEAVPPAERARLAFALFTAHDAANDPETAFGWLARGNAFRRVAQPYDLEAQARVLDALTEPFQGAAPVLSEAECAAAPASRRIVFILGMPRSGTSLVEQILASHSQVHAAGELGLLADAMKEIGWSGDEIGEGPTPDALLRLRQSYLAGISALDTDAPVVTDKMPLNFRFAGPALAALPEARVLFLRRDPVATCWSNWSKNFAGRGNNFGTDLEDLAAMYRKHLEVMAVYRAAYPDRVFEVPYERLTEDQEAESRKLVAAAGLDWEPACLDFHKTRRSVRTASAGQVRRKMYTGSSEAWRRYETQLAPLIAALGSDG